MEEQIMLRDLTNERFCENINKQVEDAIYVKLVREEESRSPQRTQKRPQSVPRLSFDKRGKPKKNIIVNIDQSNNNFYLQQQNIVQKPKRDFSEKLRDLISCHRQKNQQQPRRFLSCFGKQKKSENQILSYDQVYADLPQPKKPEFIRMNSTEEPHSSYFDAKSKSEDKGSQLAKNDYDQICISIQNQAQGQKRNSMFKSQASQILNPFEAMSRNTKMPTLPEIKNQVKTIFGKMDYEEQEQPSVIKKSSSSSDNSSSYYDSEESVSEEYTESFTSQQIKSERIETVPDPDEQSLHLNLKDLDNQLDDFETKINSAKQEIIESAKKMKSEKQSQQQSLREDIWIKEEIKHEEVTHEEVTHEEVTHEEITQEQITQEVISQKSESEQAPSETNEQSYSQDLDRVYANYDQEFKTFLENNLDYNGLWINSKFTPSARLLKAYEYFEGINSFIDGYFEQGEINQVQYTLIEQSICEYIEKLKKGHHELLLLILSYLPLKDVILKVSRLNRKLYIVSGDLDLFKQYYPKYDKFNYEDIPQKSIVQKNQKVYLYQNETLSFDGQEQVEGSEILIIDRNVQKIQNDNHLAYFRSSIRSSIESKIFNFTGQNFKPRKISNTQFDIIADKPSKFIIQLNKFFDVDPKNQINEIQVKKNKTVTENPYNKKQRQKSNINIISCKNNQSQKLDNKVKSSVYSSQQNFTIKEDLEILMENMSEQISLIRSSKSIKDVDPYQERPKKPKMREKRQNQQKLRYAQARNEMNQQSNLSPNFLNQAQESEVILMSNMSMEKSDQVLFNQSPVKQVKEEKFVLNLDKFNGRPDFIKPNKIVQKVDLKIETIQQKEKRIMKNSSQKQSILFKQSQNQKQVNMPKLEYSDDQKLKTVVKHARSTSSSRKMQSLKKQLHISMEKTSKDSNSSLMAPNGLEEQEKKQ